MADVASDELPLLRQLMEKSRWRDRLQGKAVGYGIEGDVAVIAP
jgi:hypothetical protein